MPVMVGGSVGRIYENSGCYQMFPRLYSGIAQEECVQADAVQRHSENTHSKLAHASASCVMFDAVLCISAATQFTDVEF